MAHIAETVNAADNCSSLKILWNMIENVLQDIWQEFQYAKITFQDDEIECDAQEIRELLDEDKPGVGACSSQRLASAI